MTCPEPQGAWDGAGYLGHRDPDSFPRWFMPVSARAHLLVSVLPVHRKRAHSPSSKDEHSIGLKDSLLAHSSDPVEMRRLNYQTPGKEQLTPPYAPPPPVPPCQVLTPEEELQSSPPQQLCTFSVTMADRGLRPRISRCPRSGLQILLPDPVTAGTQGWGTWTGTAYCVVCVTHYVKVTAVVLSREEPPRRAGRACKCPHLHCSRVLRWLGPGWDSALGTTGAVLATGPASGRIRTDSPCTYC